jgi:hypothetical protein
MRDRMGLDIANVFELLNAGFLEQCPGKSTDRDRPTGRPLVYDAASISRR